MHLVPKNIPKRNFDYITENINIHGHHTTVSQVIFDRQFQHAYLIRKPKYKCHSTQRCQKKKCMLLNNQKAVITYKKNNSQQNNMQSFKTLYEITVFSSHVNSK